MELTLGEEKTITTWREAVAHVSELAHAKLPATLHGHLERATALVLHGHVWLDEDGRHGQVLSSDGATWYVCNGHCTCMGATRAPEGWCKHRLSVALYKRASELLAQASRPTPPAAFPLAPFRALLAEAGVGDWRPALPALPAAPARATVRVQVAGQAVPLTLWDTDDARLLTRLATLLARYPAAPCGGQGPRPGAAPAPTTGTPTCPHHGPGKESTKAPGTWYCTKKMADGRYCRWRYPEK